MIHSWCEVQQTNRQHSRLSTVKIYENQVREEKKNAEAHENDNLWVIQNRIDAFNQNAP